MVCSFTTRTKGEAEWGGEEMVVNWTTIVEPNHYYFFIYIHLYIKIRDPELVNWTYIGMNQLSTYKKLVFIITPIGRLLGNQTIGVA